EPGFSSLPSAPNLCVPQSKIENRDSKIPRRTERRCLATERGLRGALRPAHHRSLGYLRRTRVLIPPVRANPVRPPIENRKSKFENPMAEREGLAGRSATASRRAPRGPSPVAPPPPSNPGSHPSRPRQTCASPNRKSKIENRK